MMNKYQLMAVQNALTSVEAWTAELRRQLELDASPKKRRRRRRRRRATKTATVEKPSKGPKKGRRAPLSKRSREE